MFLQQTNKFYVCFKLALAAQTTARNHVVDSCKLSGSGGQVNQEPDLMPLEVPVAHHFGDWLSAQHWPQLEAATTGLPAQVAQQIQHLTTAFLWTKKKVPHPLLQHEVGQHVASWPCVDFGQAASSGRPRAKETKLQQHQAPPQLGSSCPWTSLFPLSSVQKPGRATNQFFTVNISCSSSGSSQLLTCHTFVCCLLLLVSTVQSFFWLRQFNSWQLQQRQATSQWDSKGSNWNLGKTWLGCRINQLTDSRDRDVISFSTLQNASGVWQALGWHKWHSTLSLFVVQLFLWNRCNVGLEWLKHCLRNSPRLLNPGLLQNISCGTATFTSNFFGQNFSNKHLLQIVQSQAPGLSQ